MGWGGVGWAAQGRGRLGGGAGVVWGGEEGGGCAAARVRVRAASKIIPERTGARTGGKRALE